MRESNRGFTLVELIVSVAILGIIVAAVGAFAVSGSRAYASVSAGVDLQVESQTAMNFVREYAVDCSDGVCVGADGTLYLLCSGGEEQEGGGVAVVYTEHIFQRTDEGLIYTVQHFAVDGKPAARESGTVSGSVTAFAAELPAGQRAASVTVTMELARRGKTYTGTETLALRNMPQGYASEADLLAAIPTT
jgi:prepilin-type N-terminal cleavage/methylation domain-containing protein